MRVWDFAGVAGERGAGPALDGRRADAGRALVPGRQAQFRREPAARAGRRACDRLPQRARRPARARLAGSCAPRSRASPPGFVARRRRAGRRRRRIPAEPSGGRHRHARGGEPRRDLDLLLAGLRHRGRARPFRPGEAEGRSSPPTVISTPARPSTRWRRSQACCEALPSRPARRRRAVRERDGSVGTVAGRRALCRLRRARRARSLSRACPSSTRSTCSIRPARPACRSASCTAPAARCCSTCKEHLLHTDMKPGDRLFYFTTCGWMMWNWLASALASGATLVLYDGSPLHPGPACCGSMAADEGVTIFGTSPRYLAALEKAGYRPRERHGLAVLRTRPLDRLAARAASSSTSSPRPSKPTCSSPRSRAARTSSPASRSATRCLPVYRGELQCRGLGMKVEVWDDAGRAGHRRERRARLHARPSRPCRSASGTTRTAQRYRAAYFERFPGVWHHGDYADADAARRPRDPRPLRRRAEPGRRAHRHGRDLPPGGAARRSAESVVVGQESGQRRARRPVRAPARRARRSTRRSRERIRRRIRANTTPRHVPAKILQVPDIPRTISGKIVELAVREAIHGRPVRNTDALANPAALEHFRDRPELSG